MDHEAAQLEKQHVHDVYESTAPYFSDLQSKAWPRVRQFLQEQKPGSLVADIGCGTGKYLKVNSQVYTLGCDYCGPLVEIAQSRGCEVMVCDNLNLPFRDQGFDAIISIGVIHHFSTKQRRIRAIKEMARVLVPGGQLMIYVWAMEQKNRHFEKQDVLVPWNRALCSRLLSESSQPGRAKQCGHPERSHPCHPPCSAYSCSVCFKERCHSKRSHSIGYEPVTAGTCCAGISKESEEDNGFYNTLGKSFRSWFFSRSLDESTLRKQMERVRPLKNAESWANSTISIQPSRHSSLDLGHRELFSTREQNLDEEVFVETSQKHLEWLRAPATRKHLDRDHQEEIRRNSDGNFLNSTSTNENCVGAGNVEEGNSSASKILRRISAVDSTDSIPNDTISVEERQPNVLDSRAFMRYYHVFREVPWDRRCYISLNTALPHTVAAWGTKKVGIRRKLSTSVPAFFCTSHSPPSPHEGAPLSSLSRWKTSRGLRCQRPQLSLIPRRDLPKPRSKPAFFHHTPLCSFWKLQPFASIQIFVTAAPISGPMLRKITWI